MGQAAQAWSLGPDAALKPEPPRRRHGPPGSTPAAPGLRAASRAHPAAPAGASRASVALRAAGAAALAAGCGLVATPRGAGRRSARSSRRRASVVALRAGAPPQPLPFLGATVRRLRVDKAKGGVTEREEREEVGPPAELAVRRPPRQQGVQRKIEWQFSVESRTRSLFLTQAPEEDTYHPEIALFGLSNVGKSSLINFLCQKKLLSTVSKHAGHTKLLHHFLLKPKGLLPNKKMEKDAWFLVDLPGIGGFEDAKSPLNKKAIWKLDRSVTAYVRHRSTLVNMFFLVDASKPVRANDLQGIKWLTDIGMDLTIVFTKMDKKPERGALSTHPGGPAELMEAELVAMQESPFLASVADMPPMFETSSEKKLGRDKLLDHAMELVHAWKVGRRRHFKQLGGGANAWLPGENDLDGAEGAKARRGKTRVPSGPPPEAMGIR
ncbi:unnamed protein product [Prorocentrum cordatum]|uniref:EngB-type G domain-containing protein n=1 Tax=Prorocentrum cordatum TaxID=2364126 RepID=A0ABN9QCV0_9DINO|nr:unnamed protein product [Polarella glacialis]